MNAYELADWIENSVFHIQDDGTTVGVSEEAVYKSATMLRQQADRITELQKALMLAGETKWDIVKDGKIIESNYEVSSKPVAWMCSVNGETVYVGYEPVDGYMAIPLYTHPVKQLSNKKIKNLWIKSNVNGALEFEIVNIFARAIIKEITE